MAVRQNRPDVVRLLLENGADPGQSRYTYNSWDKLLATARERGFEEIEGLLVGEMTTRFSYDKKFVDLADSIRSEDMVKIDSLLGARTLDSTNSGVVWDKFYIYQGHRVNTPYIQIGTKRKNPPRLKLEKHPNAIRRALHYKELLDSGQVDSQGEL